MSNKIVSPGLVIRELPVKDSNSLLTILTATHGLVTATAYGARKSGGSLSTGTKLFNYTEFSLVESRGYYKVDSAKSLEQFFALSNSVEALTAASYFAELLRDICPPGEGDAGILRLSLNALYALARGKRPHQLVKAAFELRLMDMAGFTPELDGCAACGGEDTAYFSIPDACLYCQCCAAPRSATGEQLWRLTPGTADAMRYIVSADLPRLFSFSLGEEAADALYQICEGYVRAQTDRSYDSLAIYHSLVDI